MTRPKEAKVKTLAIPLVVIAALLGFITILSKFGIAAAISFWFASMIAIAVWSLGQFRRARRFQKFAGWADNFLFRQHSAAISATS